ncbi:right-handed parallel beta-helix repeat-containing protein [Bacillus sp. UNC438CL73TsuS30]|uniref:right-handed parallel beta-helix repeat-containing protein n=1 Tax=Bacillus sp. UNC438CL73TsuS30 TaxID=1340434 RepID=UPI0018CC3A8F|nr:BppU family phage baseplate upper protein [Bacillus sp. UNC438CL73TsuS30]
MVKQYNILLDTKETVKNPSFNVNTNDLKSLQLNILINQDNGPLDLTGATVRLAVIKPDKKTVLQDCTIVDPLAGSVQIILDTQAYAIAGIYQAEVMVFYGTDTVAVTCQFSYKANKGILDDKTVESTNEFQSLVKAISDAESIKTDAKTSADAAAASAQSAQQNAQETIAARTNASGTTYTNLKARLDNTDSSLAEKAKKKKTDPWVDVVSDYGADPSGTIDTTALIQNALNSGVSKVHIPDGTFLINAVTDSNDNPSSGGLSIPSNTTLVLSPKTILKVITNGSGRYAVIRVADAENVKIIGGQILGDRSTHTGTTGSWGYGIIINGSKNVTIEDTIIKDCWGDGIFINGGVIDKTIPCENIKIKKVISDNNRRQGMSVQFCDGLFLESSSFINTNGASPQSGIDLEPIVTTSLKNVVINSCKFLNNTGDGIQVNPGVTKLAIKSSVFKGNDRGISLYQMSEANVISNLVQENRSIGINVQTSSAINVSNNICVSNGTHGIALSTQATKNTITNNLCKANTSNGIIASASNENNIVGNTCIDNIAQGIYNYSSAKNNVVGNQTNNNSIGIQSSSSNNTQIANNYCIKNKNEGIKITGCNNENLLNNSCAENSQANSISYDNILIYTTNYSNIQSNFCRQGSQTNKPRHGIYIQDAGSSNNTLFNNDCYTGGATNGVRNLGMSTILGVGNRNNDGTFSTTPN